MQMKADNPIALADITQMSDDEVELLLTQIRERRLSPVRVYEELTLMKAEARKALLEEMLVKQLTMFEKDLARLDSNIEKVELRARKLRGIKLEIESL